MLSSSESAVLVSVLVNPTSATLRPTDRVFEVSASFLRQVAPSPFLLSKKQGRTTQEGIQAKPLFGPQERSVAVFRDHGCLMLAYLVELDSTWMIEVLALRWSSYFCSSRRVQSKPQNT